MARVAVLGEPLRIGGYGLAGALICPARDQPEALRGWRELPGDVAVVVLTPQAESWLGDELAARPDVLTVLLPDSMLSASMLPASGAPASGGPG
jgi:hypothetical protein